MYEPIQFPDAVMLVVHYLRSCMPSTLVYSRVPEGTDQDPRPPEFIRIERLGGLQNSIVTDRPRISVSCWSDTEFNAAQLMQTTRAHMSAIAGSREGHGVFRVAEVAGPQWLPDQKSSQPRYSFAVEFTVRGTRME